MNTFKNISLGNDVVDFLDPDTVDLREKPKFIERVYTSSEVSDYNDNIHLWRIWAAKEAAYKAVKRLKPEIAFSPRLFQVRNYQSSEHSADINYQDTIIKLQFVENSEYIHALATISETGNFPDCEFQITDFTSLKDILNERELQESYSAESSLCRTWAVLKLEKYYNSSDIRITKLPETGSVPVIYVNGKKTSQMISLSHHGRFCGIFFTCP